MRLLGVLLCLVCIGVCYACFVCLCHVCIVVDDDVVVVVVVVVGVCCFLALGLALVEDGLLLGAHLVHLGLPGVWQDNGSRITVTLYHTHRMLIV